MVASPLLNARYHDGTGMNMRARIISENSAYEVEKKFDKETGRTYYSPKIDSKGNKTKTYNLANATKLNLEDIKALLESGYSDEEIDMIMDGEFEFDLKDLAAKAGDIWLSYITEPMADIKNKPLYDWGVPVNGVRKEGNEILSETLEFGAKGVFLIQHRYPDLNIEVLSNLFHEQEKTLTVLSGLLLDPDMQIRTKTEEVLNSLKHRMLNLNLRYETILAIEEAEEINNSGAARADANGTIRNIAEKEIIKTAAAGAAAGTQGEVVAAAKGNNETSDIQRVLLHGTVENAIEAVVITDPQGTITYVNQAMVKMSGYSKEELIGQNPRMLKSGRHDEAFYKEFWETINAGRTWTGIFINKRKNNDTYLERQVIVPVKDTGGSITSFIALKQDVTEAIEVEEALEAERERDTILSERLGDTVHNIKNLLQRILSETDEWRRREWWNISEAERERLNNINAVSALVIMMIESNLSAVRGEAIKEPLDVNNLIGESIASLDIKGVVLRKDFEAKPRNINGNYIQLAQVLTNLISNAKEAILARQQHAAEASEEPPAGEIKISTKTKTIREQDLADITFIPTDAQFRAGEQIIEIQVSDTGIGIEKSDIYRIFEPRFTTKKTGTGIGLSWVRRTINEHGGMIGVKSVPGEGSTFIVWLPVSTELTIADRAVVTQARALRQEEITIPYSEAQQYSILIVDDDERVREVLLETLKGRGFINIHQAHDAESALEALHRLKDDKINLNAVITDQKISEIGIRGTEMLSKALEEGLISGDTFRLVVSGSREEEIAEGLRETGASYIAKPYQATTLVNVLIRGLRGEEAPTIQRKDLSDINTLMPASLENDIAAFRHFIHEYGNAITLLSSLPTLLYQMRRTAPDSEAIHLLDTMNGITEKAIDFQKMASDALPHIDAIKEKPEENETLRRDIYNAFEILEKGVLPKLKQLRGILTFVEKKKLAEFLPNEDMYNVFADGVEQTLSLLGAFLNENRDRYGISQAAASGAAAASGMKGKELEILAQLEPDEAGSLLTHLEWPFAEIKTALETSVFENNYISNLKTAVENWQRKTSLPAGKAETVQKLLNKSLIRPLEDIIFVRNNIINDDPHRTLKGQAIQRSHENVLNNQQTLLALMEQIQSTLEAAARPQGEEIAEKLQAAVLEYGGSPAFGVILDCTEPKGIDALKILVENLPKGAPVGVIVNNKNETPLANGIMATSIQDQGTLEAAVKFLRADLSMANSGKNLEFKLLTLRKNLPYLTIDDVKVITPGPAKIFITLNGLITSIDLSAKKDPAALNEALAAIAARLESV